MKIQYWNDNCNALLLKPEVGKIILNFTHHIWIGVIYTFWLSAIPKDRRKVVKSLSLDTFKVVTQYLSPSQLHDLSVRIHIVLKKGTSFLEIRVEHMLKSKANSWFNPWAMVIGYWMSMWHKVAYHSKPGALLWLTGQTSFWMRKR